MAVPFTRDEFEARDAADSLAAFRDRFVIGTDEIAIYANGNSLGRPPRETAPRVAALIDQWGHELTAGWGHWIDLPFEVGDRLGAACLGAASGQVAIADSTSVNLYKAISAVMSAAGSERRTLVVAADEFPTDRYLLQSVAEQHGAELRVVPTADAIVDAVDDTCALAALSLVNYRSGELLDLAAVTAALRSRGVTAVWDLSHAVGAVPVELDRAGVELAVGCTYKYLNGGPGAPAFLYVSAETQSRLRQPLWGWFGQRDLFAMGDRYDPADGIRAWMVGTPNIAGTCAVDVGVALIAEAGLAALREKSVALTSAAASLAQSWLEPLGATVASPADPEQRGAHVAVAHPRAQQICASLVDERLVVPDFRFPDVIRLGFAPLYTRFTDVWDALDRTRSVMEHFR
ncbi:MAG TPA: kynureninase [Acidimicrobiales bacterium]|nr:kynureninase [Acidimicrobiales bacterium]